MCRTIHTILCLSVHTISTKQSFSGITSEDEKEERGDKKTRKKRKKNYAAQAKDELKRAYRECTK